MDLETRIRVILLMGEFKSPILVLRTLKRERLDKVSWAQAIFNIYKFCSFGTVLDLAHTGRPKISDDQSTDPIKRILEENPQIDIDRVQRCNRFEPINRSTSNQVQNKNETLQDTNSASGGSN